MNTALKHDPETGDLRGHSEIVGQPDNIGDLPNTDAGDMRGREPSPVTGPETDSKRIFVGVAAVAGLIGVLGVASYAMGMWSTPRPTFAPHVAAPTALPAVEQAVVPPPHVVVPPAAPVEAAPVEAAPPVKAVHAAVTKRAPALQVRPAPPETIAPAPPETIAPAPPMNTTLAPAPPVQISPTPAGPALPELSLPDLPTAPPQATPPPQ